MSDSIKRYASIVIVIATFSLRLLSFQFHHVSTDEGPIPTATLPSLHIDSSHLRNLVCLHNIFLVF